MWFKIHADEWLTRTISEDPLEMQAIFVKLLCLAADPHRGPWGFIAFNEKIGFTDEQLADEMKIIPELWAEAKAFQIESPRILLHPGNIIEILNWKEYQSDYARQSPYRQEKKEREKKEKKPKTTESRSRGKTGNEKLLRKVIDQEYIEELKARFPTVDVKHGIEDCIEYYTNGKGKVKKLKSAKLTFSGWMKREVGYQEERQPTDRPLTEHQRQIREAQQRG